MGVDNFGGTCCPRGGPPSRGWICTSQYFSPRGGYEEEITDRVLQRIVIRVQADLNKPALATG